MKGVDVHISLRYWNVYKEGRSIYEKLLYSWEKEKIEDNGHIECHVDLDRRFLQYERWSNPPYEDYAEVADLVARGKQWILPMMQAGTAGHTIDSRFMVQWSKSSVDRERMQVMSIASGGFALANT